MIYMLISKSNKPCADVAVTTPFTATSIEPEIRDGSSFRTSELCVQQEKHITAHAESNAVCSINCLVLYVIVKCLVLI